MTIREKLAAVQLSLKAPKNQFNSFGKYNYRSCEDILEALKPLLSVNQVSIVLTDTVEAVGNRNYIKATARLYDLESVDSIEVTAFAREDETKKGMDGSQITGAASSYARKYALNGLFAIDDTKDADVPSNESVGVPILCRKCGKTIDSARTKNGEMKTPKQVSEATGGLCKACWREQQAAGEIV